MTSGWGDPDDAGASLPSGRMDLGSGHYFEFDSRVTQSLFEQRELFDGIQSYGNNLAWMANEMADPNIAKRTSDPLYECSMEMDPELGPVATVGPANFFGHLDDAHNSTMAKVSFADFDDDFSGPMTPGESEDLEAMARWQNDEDDEDDDEEEEVQYRDRPVRLKPTRDPAWRNIPE